MVGAQPVSVGIRGIALSQLMVNGCCVHVLYTTYENTRYQNITSSHNKYSTTPMPYDMYD